MGLIDNVNVNVGGNGNIIDTLSTYVTKLLKPNIVDGVNVLMQDMMSAQNTKYVIKYDYKLAEDITVPANCILEFDGGSISGEHTITGQNTIIKAAPVEIFGADIEFDGTWKAEDYLCEWFGGDVEKCINTFANISFVQETIIHFPVHINRWATLNFKASRSIKVADDFVGEYLFEALLDQEVPEPTESNHFENPNLAFNGCGYIDLNNKTCFVRALKVERTPRVAGMLTFYNVLCYNAAKAIDNENKVAIVWSECLVNCISSNFGEERFKSGRLAPDYGFYLGYTDNRFVQTNICISTIGIYRCQGNSYFSQVHIWGTPEICFYITGDSSFDQCYSDWGKVAYYYDGVNHINISAHSFVGPAKNNETYKDVTYYIVKTRLAGATIYGFVTIANISDSRINLIGYGTPDGDTTPYTPSLLSCTPLRFEWYNKINSNTDTLVYRLKNSNIVRVPLEKGHLVGIVSDINNSNRGIKCKILDTYNSSTRFIDLIIEPNEVVFEGATSNIDFYIENNTIYGINNDDTTKYLYFDLTSVYEMSGVMIGVSDYPQGEYPSSIQLNTPIPKFGTNSRKGNSFPTGKVLSNNVVVPNWFINDDYGKVCFYTGINNLGRSGWVDSDGRKPISLFGNDNPTGLGYTDRGASYFNTSLSKPVFWNGGKWIEADRCISGILRWGTTAQREAIVQEDVFLGFKFWDTNLKKAVTAAGWGSGTSIIWRESDGAIASVKRSGTKVQRPSGSDIYVGFQYMQVDTTNGTFPIWASAISGDTVTWVKADGTDPDQ